MPKSILSIVNHLAWKLRKIGLSWSEAMKTAYSAIKEKTYLQGKLWALTFKKKSDGSTTTRIAAFHPDFIPSGVGDQKVTFWSISDSAYRSYIPNNLVSFSPIQFSNH